MLRIDKILWYLRLSPSRAVAKRTVQQGHIRLNGRRVDRAHTAVRQGDILTIPWQNSAVVLRIIDLPDRRGPLPNAQRCYEILQTNN